MFGGLLSESCRYENAFSLKTEDRYSSGLRRNDSWDSPTDNAVEDISSTGKDTSSDKLVLKCLLSLCCDSF